jgi:mRNA interferase HigB
MKIVNYEIVMRFTKKHADARAAFKRWRDLTEAAIWHSHDDVKRTFPSADKYKACTIFDIGGNKYRLIAKINYDQHVQIVNVREAMTHAEYDKDKWKSDCESG